MHRHFRSSPLKDQSATYEISGSTLHLLHRAGQVVEVLFEKSLGLDLTARQLIVLAVVSESANPSQASLCSRTGIDRSTMADIVARLAARGLLTRERAPYDARMYEIHLTSLGKDTLAKALPVAREVDAMLLGSLSIAEREGFEAGLRKIATHVNLADQAA